MSSPHMDSTNPSLETTPVARLNPLARLIGVLFSPTETFQDIKQKPNWLIPIILTVVIYLIGNYVILKKLNVNWEKFARQQVEQAFERQGKSIAELPPDQKEALDKQIKLQAAFSPYIAIIAPCLTPVFVVILALLFWGAATLLQSNWQAPYRRVFSLTSYIFCTVTVLTNIVLSVIVVFLRDPEDINITEGIAVTNPGMLMPQGTSAILKTLLSRLDVLTIWFLILMSLGLAIISDKVKVNSQGKIRMGSSLAIVFSLWGVYVLLSIAVAAIFGR